MAGLARARYRRQAFIFNGGGFEELWERGQTFKLLSGFYEFL